MKRSTKHLDGLDAIDLAAAILAELGNPAEEEIVAQLADALEAVDAGGNIAALLDALDNPPVPAVANEGDDLAELLELLESPQAVAQRGAELKAINKERERVIRKHYGNRR